MRTIASLLALLLIAGPVLAVDGNTSLKVLANTSKTLDLGTVSFPLNWTSTQAWTDGTGAAKYQIAWTDTRTTDGTGEDLDLAGVLKDAFGQTLTFTIVKVIAVSASSANTQPVVIGAGGHPISGLFGDAASDTIKVRPGGTITIVAPDATGYPVTATSADDLMIKAGATASVTYSIMVLGEGSGS